MPTRRALIIGGTGMLAPCALALAMDGWRVVLPSRRHMPISTTPAEQITPDCGQALWVEANWSDPEGLAKRAGKALGGPADLLVAWVHEEHRAAVLRAVAPLLASDAVIVEVHDSSSADQLGDYPQPTLPNKTTQQVVLGCVRSNGSTRWLTHQEISTGVLAAIHRALAASPPAIHQVGEPLPMQIRS